MNKYTYNTDEIFQDIPNDPENVMMKIPDEILAETGWKEGDVLNIKAEDGKITISKKNG
jgi:hypothetical protein